MPARQWTPEQRQQQSERIRAWGPWVLSTGPKTAEGKAVSAGNAWKGGNRQILRDLSLALKTQKESLDRL